MDFRECMLCGKTEIIWDLVAMNDTHGKRMGFRCKDGKCALPKSPPRTFFESLDLSDQKPNTDGSFIKSYQRPATSTDFIQETDVHPLQEQFGFQKPEDGSGRRFVFNAVKQGETQPGIRQPVTVPWVKFRFWWFLHNAVAHPLIAVIPRKTFFEFHDYTSRRMHGIRGK